MKGKNRIKSMLLALLLSLSMVVTYLPASMIAYAETEDGVVAEQSVDTEVNTDDTQDVDINEPSEEGIIDVVPEDLEEEEEVEEVETESLGNEEATEEKLLMESSEMQLNADADKEPAREVKAVNDGITVLAFTSDIHNASNNTAANRLDAWFQKVESELSDEVDVMSFCGDMGEAGDTSDRWWNYVQSVMNVVDDEEIPGVYTTGNHEFYNGKFNTTSSSVKNEYIVDGEGLSGDNYRIYCLGTDNWNNNSDNYTAEQITKLTQYLNSVDASKPIIVLTHFPLHHYSSRTTANADGVINALNDAADSGKKIVLLWGHNHTMSDTNYDEIFEPGESIEYKSGSSKELKFYYGAAGCMSDSEYGSGSAYVKGKGLIITINQKDQLSFTYYDANANNVTEGGTFTEQDPIYPTSISVSPQALEVEVGRTSKAISVSYAPDSTNQKGIIWTTSDASVATVKDGKVKGVSVGSATITATSADGACTATCEVSVVPRTTQQTSYIIKVGNYVLSTERSSDSSNGGNSSQFPWGGSGSTYTGLAAVDYSSATSNDDTISWIIEETDGGYYIMSEDGRYLNATYTSSGSGGYGGGSSTSNLKLDDTPDVWVLDDGVDIDSWVDGSYLMSSNTGRYLCEETGTNGSHLFSVRSKSSSDETSIEDTGSLNEEVQATSIAVSPKTTTVEAGSTKSLKVTFSPDNTTNKKVTWSSSDTSVATVSSSGVVTGVAKGSAEITATYTDNTEITDTCTVTVTKVAGSGVEPESGKKYVILASDGYALTSAGDEVGYSNGSDDQLYNYNGLTGEEYTIGSSVTPDRLLWEFVAATRGGNDYYIKSNDGRYLNATYEKNETGGYDGTLKLDDIQDIWTITEAPSGSTVSGNVLRSANASQSDAGDKYLTHGNGNEDLQNIFTVRSDNNATAATFYEYNDDGTYVSDPDEPTPVDPPTPTEGNTYKLVNSFTAGKDYLIVSANSAGSGYALTNPGGTSDGANMGRTSVTIQSGDVDGDGTSDVYISNDATDIVWTAATNGSGYDITNNGDYLEGKSGNVKIFNPQQYSDRYWTYSDSQLQHHGGQNTYTVYYSGSNFTSSYNSTSDKIYIYEKTEPVQGEDPVESVALNKTETTLAEGDTEKLVATVSPATAADKSVTWSSSDETIAAVDQTGKVTAVKEGTATITVTTTDGGKTASCTVTVTAAPEETTVDITPSTSNPEKSETIKVGAILTINVTNGSQNSGYDYTATFSNSGIAQIEGNSTINIAAGATKPFTVKGTAAGTVDITIKNSQSSNQYARTSVVHLTVVDDDTPIEPPTPGDGDTYKLVDQFTDGNEYLIVSANSAGSGYALTNPGATSGGASMGSTAVTIESGDVDGDGAADRYITSDATNIVWTAATNKSGFSITNDGGFLEGKSGNVKIYSEQQYPDRYWTYNNNYLLHEGGSYTYEVYYNNGFTFNQYNSGDPSHPVYIYEKTEPVAGEDSVESVALNKTETTLAEGATEKLVATVSPATAADKSVTWSSSDEAIATVSEDGTVTAVKEGTATITVTTNDGGKTASCTVTVEAYVAPERTRYVLTNELEAGKKYVIASSEAAGSTYILGHDGTAAATYSANIVDEGGELTIIEQKEDIAFEAAEITNGFSLTNGEYYMTVEGAGELTFSKSSSTKYWKYTDDNKLSNASSSATRYLTFSSNEFKGYYSSSNPNPSDIFLYVLKVEGECVHDWSDWTVTIEPTCTAKGVETRMCSKCEESETREIDPLGHTPGEEKVENNVEPTCTAAGSYDKVVYCTVCGEELSRNTVDVPALGHNMKKHDAVPVTCTANGSREFWSCDRCGKFFSDEAGTEEIATESWIIPATGHTSGEPVHENEKPATCKTEGTYDEVIYCAVCGEELSRTPITAEALGHTWGEWEVTTPATELKEGVKTRTCSVCGDTETRSIPNLEHTHHLTKVDAHAATCEAEGNTAYWTCNEGENPCGKYFSDEAGTIEIEKDSWSIPATGHTEGDEVVENNADPTCTAAGSYDKVVYCTVCGKELSRETVNVAALGHTWSEWKDKKPATELEEGEQTRTCSICGETETRVIPKLDHVHHTTKVEYKEATCTEAGNIEHWVCSGGENPCRRLFEDEEATKELNSEDVIIPATGHDWKAHKWTWANDNSSATTTFICNNDNSHVEEVEASVTFVTTDATCETDGKTVYTAIAEFEGRQYIYEKEVAIPKIGHEYELTGWTWAEDFSTATATFTCKNDSTHVETVEASVTSATTNATCEDAGKTSYAALVTFNNEDYTDTKETVIPATGHDYELERWIWNGYTEAVAVFTCKNNSNHFVNVKAEITSETIEATCNAEGRTTYTAVATFKGVKYPYIQTVTIPKKEHDWYDAIYSWADDYSTVTATRICKDFAAHVETETVETTSEVTKPAGCVAKGETTYTAEFKNNSFRTQTKTETNIDALGHDWGEWEVTTPATELKEGIETKTCSRCGRTETRTIPKLGHTHHMKSVPANEPTCEAAGNTAYWICSEGDNPCGRYFSDEAGTIEIEKDSWSIPATGHTQGEEVVENNVDPTCTAAGSYDKVVYCTICGKELSRETVNVAALGHTWSEWKDKKPATELEEGEQTRTCSVCGETETRVIPKLDHVHQTTKVEYKEATCTEAGNIEHWVCSGGENPCRRLFEDEEATKELNSEDVIIPAKGHMYGEPVYKWGTDNLTVTAKTVCSICGEDITEQVAAKLDKEKSIAPTCEEAGKDVYTSEAFRKYDGFEGQRKEIAIPATGHDWSEWTVKTPATEKTEGAEKRSCTLCGKTETRAVPKLEPAPVPTPEAAEPGSDPNQKGTDGTEVGPGASAAAAEKAITGMKKDTDPAGAVFCKLTLNSPKQTTRTITLKWTKVSKAKKYVIYGNYCGRTKPKKLYTLTGNTKTTKVIRKISGKMLKKGQYSKFIVVALDKNNNVVATSKLIHVATKGGKVGNDKKVKVSKSVLNKAKALKAGKKLKLNAKPVPQSSKLKVKRHVDLRYESTNKKVATVTKKGVIKAKKKGTCYVYVYAQSGVFKKIKVVVK